MDKSRGQKIKFFKVSQLLKRYFVAVWTVGLTFVITLLISPFVPPDISSLFLVAVMVSAWRGGLSAGLLATLLSVLIDIFIFLPPTASFSLENDDFVQLLVDVFAAIVVGMLSASKRKAEDERKELLLSEQKARIEAENANKIKDEFLAAVSHELRTPLTTIKTLTRILLKKDPPKEDRLGYLEDIASECDRQIDLVHNLLDLSRIKAGGVEIKSEQVVIEEVLVSCEKIERVGAAEREHRIVLDVPPDLPDVCAGRDALRRVICTIIENAVKYTPNGGTIKLKSYPDLTGEHIYIEISDNGLGIDKKDLPHIFESYYRGGRIDKEKIIEPQENFGVGLGLYLARSLVEAMNGEITVESRAGRGSIFTVRLPKWKPRSLVNETNPSGSGREIQRFGKSFKNV